MESFDVAVVGGGPAGLQAALVLARTRKKILVLDAPRAPRNAASHGVHNFLGLDGLLPGEIRKRAWKQIDVYKSACLRDEQVVAVRRSGDGRFVLDGADGGSYTATKLILAFGYHDVFPDVPGFLECWSDSVIPCPFCDGFENRDRVWGVVPGDVDELALFPKLALNWTSSVKVFLQPGLGMEEAQRSELAVLGIPVHQGTITEVHCEAGKVEAVTLDSDQRVPVQTLLWKPKERPSTLIDNLVSELGLEVDDEGHVVTDEQRRTNLPEVWAAGDVEGWAGGLGAAAAGNEAAAAIVRSWYS